ncbi:hypothetical protein [Geodermatophilus sp. CPCC 206100]|uniref:hypothetical protein n=1 Tax=Geodermatophilus sp. CPCC 206100 TaxID=3020054 RepID=UPI003B0025E3
MRELTIDGIPAFVADGPAPLSAGLVFAVGRRDESFVRGGLTHLVEHLAMSALPRTTLDANASVGLSVTEFTATGSPEQVAAFLRGVCAALADPPTDRLAVEAGVLRTEAGTTTLPATAALLGQRYGSAGLGLAAMREPALRSLTAEDVRSWARDWFVRGNAALWLSGPVPEDLVLPLADGPRPERPAQHRRELPTPAWTELPFDGSVAVGAEVPTTPALGTTLAVLRERVEEELRHRRGVAYTVAADRLVVDAWTDFAGLVTDARAGQETVAARLVWRELDRLATEGPRPEELHRERDRLAAFLADPRSGAETAAGAARSAVGGLPVMTAATLRAQADAVTSEEVRAAAAALRGAAVLGLPGGAEPPAGLPRLPEGSADVVAGRAFPPRRGSAVPRGAVLVVGEDGLSLSLGEGGQATVRWPEVVGLVRCGSRAWTLVGRAGLDVLLVAADWRDGEEALAMVRAAVPAELQVADDDSDDDGVLVVRAPVHRVRETVAVSRDSLRVVGGEEWTAVVPDGIGTALDRAVTLAGAAGFQTVGIVLRRDLADLEYVLLRGGREVDRHRWGVSSGDPRLLAEATGRPLSAVADVLADEGEPAEVLDRFVALLELPAVVPALLDGQDVPADRVDGLGMASGLRAALRGDYAAPRGSGTWVDRWARLSWTRPGWYRAAQAAAALVFALCAVGLLAVDGLGWWADVLGWVSVLLALGSLWDVRPPRREPAPGDQRPEVPTPTG